MTEIIHILLEKKFPISIAASLFGLVARLIWVERQNQLAISRDKRSEIVSAGVKFWDSVNLNKFSLLSSHELRSAIIQHYEPQNRAAENFSRVLPDDIRAEFEQDWENYVAYRSRTFNVKNLANQLDKFRKYTN
jgi:hypothetical protein